MAMNWLHRRFCSSRYWAKAVEDKLLPWALRGVELGDNVLEIGPGYGANLRVLTRTARVTAVEINAELAARLEHAFGAQATVLVGDGAAMPLPEHEFSSVVCFTMLHHVPTPRQQDRLFTEACRVLRPGGTFAGCDGVHSVPFRLIHLGDTCNPVSADTLPERLAAAGFGDIEVRRTGRQLRFRCRKPERQ